MVQHRQPSQHVQGPRLLEDVPDVGAEPAACVHPRSDLVEPDSSGVLDVLPLVLGLLERREEVLPAVQGTERVLEDALSARRAFRGLTGVHVEAADHGVAALHPVAPLLEKHRRHVVLTPRPASAVAVVVGHASASRVAVLRDEYAHARRVLFVAPAPGHSGLPLRASQRCWPSEPAARRRRRPVWEPDQMCTLSGLSASSSTAEHLHIAQSRQQLAHARRVSFHRDPPVVRLPVSADSGGSLAFSRGPLLHPLRPQTMLLRLEPARKRGEGVVEGP